MTESRPPGSSRHAQSGSSDRDGANPLQRPLPPGLSRRSAERDAPARAARPEPAAASPFRAPPARPGPSVASHASPAAPERSAPTRGAVGAGAEAGAGRRSRTATPSRPPAAASAIPLMAPPPWQVKETQAGERQQAEERAVTTQQRGLPSWLGLIVLLVITGIGGLIDAVAGAGIKGAFAIGLIVGSLAAILLVRRSAMFPIVVAPPLVYFIASAVLLYVRSGGLSNRAAVTDAAASWLVYGFPAIAGATAVVLIVAGVRMILHR